MIRILYKDEAVREIEKPGMEPGDVSEVVTEIIASVRARGDEALHMILAEAGIAGER